MPRRCSSRSRDEPSIPCASSARRATWMCSVPTPWRASGWASIRSSASSSRLSSTEPPRRSATASLRRWPPPDALAVGGDADEHDRHLVGGSFAPVHLARRLARLTQVLGGVVEHRLHVDARAARERHGLRERVVALPAEIPVV